MGSALVRISLIAAIEGPVEEAVLTAALTASGRVSYGRIGLRADDWSIDRWLAAIETTRRVRLGLAGRLLGVG
jgi:hypothetical protein